MPAPVKFDDSYGYLTFEFEPTAVMVEGERPPRPVRLDVYETHKAYADVMDAHKEDADAHAAGLAWREHLYGLGFPPMSVANGYQVVRQVVAEMDRLGKAGAGSGSAG